MTKKTQSTTGKLQDKPPADYVSFMAIPQEERYRIEVTVPPSSWKTLVVQACHEVPITPEQRDAITKGEMTCPRCTNGVYLAVQEGFAVEVRDDGEVIERKVYRREPIKCDCQIWKHIWKLVKRELPLAYQKYSLHTLKPDLLSRLPLAAQEEELGYVREHESENFIFYGPPGTSKTTIAYALYRAAYERDSAKFWHPTLFGLPYKDRRWIWRGNFNDLLNQFNAKQKDQDGSVPDPEVTQQKIKNAARDGFHPVLIIEEVDKIDLNSHRINFLFHLIDEIINANGQLILTTNLTMAEFRDNLTANEDIRTTGDTIIRRLTDHVNNRNLFEFC